MNYELQLIACCLLDKSIISKSVAVGVQPEWFTDDIHRQVWTTAVERNAEGKTVDLVWAEAYYESITGGADIIYTDAIHDVLVPKSEAMSAVEVMKENYQKRQLSDISFDLNRRVNSEIPVVLINETYEKLERLKRVDSDKPQQNIEEEIAEQLKRGIQAPTGFPKLDYLVKGIEPGVLWVIGGYTSHGKTTFALNLAYNQAVEERPVTVFSTEMSRTLLYKRINTMVSGINPSIAASLTEEEKQAYLETLHNTTLELPVELHCTLSLPEIRMIVQQARSKLYVVDYIQMIDPGTREDSEVKRLGRIVRELERLTKDHDVCIIATSQFRRDGGDGPTLSSYRGSGEIEENTDIGILMFYPYQQAGLSNKKFLEEYDGDNVINIGVLKNRIHGLTGKIQVEFDRWSLRMTEREADQSTHEKTEGGD